MHNPGTLWPDTPHLPNRNVDSVCISYEHINQQCNCFFAYAVNLLIFVATNFCTLPMSDNFTVKKFEEVSSLLEYLTSVAFHFCMPFIIRNDKKINHS